MFRFFILYDNSTVARQAEGRFFQSWVTVVVEYCAVHYFENLVFVGFEPFEHLVIYSLAL